MSSTETSYAVLLTDRKELGRAIRLLAEDSARDDRGLHATRSPRRARLFKCAQDAKAWLTRQGWDDPRYCVTIDTIVIPPRNARPERIDPPSLPLVFEIEARCNRCNWSRHPGVHPCPRCRCPEYRIEEPSCPTTT